MSGCYPKVYLQGIQPQAIKLIITMLLAMVILCCADVALAVQQKSQRIEVYALSQNYRDTKPGDTLDEIAAELLPNNPAKRVFLKQDLVRLNPHAFINNDPARLLANTRLWLPVYMKQADSVADPETTIVERYSWGNIKRRRH